MLDADAAYLALKARDARFDGRFFVGVSSTGIYCRPICRVKLPLKANCHFFDLAAQAEQAGFRPCLRCRPELAPGVAPQWSQMDASATLARQAAELMQTEPDLAWVAKRLGVTDRHLRRIFTAAYGVAPVQYLQTQRLLLAKAMLTDTTLKVTDIAAASGFGSLRRFHAAFRERYRLNPLQLRKSSTENAPAASPSAMALKLAWRPPFDVQAFMRFLQQHDVSGLERTSLENGQWRHVRTLRLWATGPGGQRISLDGWVEVRPMVTDAVSGAGHWQVLASASLAPSLHRLPALLRRWLDTDADPDAIAAGLASLPLGPDASPPSVAPKVAGTRVPGVPGEAAAFELAVRTIVGQQVSLKAAATLTQRVVQAFGAPLPPNDADTPSGLGWAFPTPQALAQASPEALGRLGLVRQRVRAIQTLSQQVAAGQLSLDSHQDLPAFTQALVALPGIGPWTANYLAMRVLRDPDIFLDTDVALLIQLSRQTGSAQRLAPRQAREMAQGWAPWRSYAVMALWNHYLE